MATPFDDQALVDGLDDRLDTGAESAVGIAAAEGDLAPRSPTICRTMSAVPLATSLRMRDDDDADRIVHCRASSVSQTACRRTQLERAPGSMWPMLRAPRNDARPLVACIGAVRAAASRAVARTRSIRSPTAGLGLQRIQNRNQHVEHRLLAGLRTAARAHRLDAAAEDLGKIVGQLLLSTALRRPRGTAAVERPGRAADRHHQSLADAS